MNRDSHYFRKREREILSGSAKEEMPDRHETLSGLVSVALTATPRFAISSDLASERFRPGTSSGLASAAARRRPEPDTIPRARWSADAG